MVCTEASREKHKNLVGRGLRALVMKSKTIFSVKEKFVINKMNIKLLLGEALEVPNENRWRARSEEDDGGAGEGGERERDGRHEQQPSSC